MKTITLTLDDEVFQELEVAAKKRGISPAQAASEDIHRRAYEAKHGQVSDDDLAELDAAVAEADRGEFASDEEVDAFFRKYRA